MDTLSLVILAIFVVALVGAIVLLCCYYVRKRHLVPKDAESNGIKIKDSMSPKQYASCDVAESHQRASSNHVLQELTNFVEDNHKQILYNEQELHLHLLHLESLDDLIVTVKNGRKFIADIPCSVRITVRNEKTISCQETHVVRGRTEPAWNCHLSFAKIDENDLGDLSVRVTAIAYRDNKRFEIGSVLISADSPQISARQHWMKVLAKEGIVSSWHQLARNV